MHSDPAYIANHLTTPEQETQEQGIDLKNPELFAHIWHSSRENLFWLALRILDNKQEAEDLVTEAFVKLHESTNAFANEAAARGWLRVIVRNSALQAIQHKQKQNHLLGELASMHHDIETQWHQEDILARILVLLHEEIEALPPKSRTVFKMKYLQQLSNEAIAQQMGIEYQSVSNHLVRALKALRLSMGQYAYLLSIVLLFLRPRE